MPIFFIKKGFIKRYIKGSDIVSDNELFKSITTDEVVKLEDAIKAYYILYHAEVKTSSDVYLFLASINLLSTFAKQNKKRISYSFKSRLFFLNDLLIYNDFEDIKVCYQATIGSCLYMIQVKDVQFSFHEVRIEKGSWDLLKKYQAQLSWDRIRKQKCAETVFNTALNKSDLTKLTRNYEDLYTKLDEVVDRFNKGELLLAKNGLVDINGVFI